MQSLTTFRCSVSTCHHRCDIHRGDGPFSDLFNTCSNSSYATIICPGPACGTRLYHCRLCMFNSKHKPNFERHARTIHANAATNAIALNDNDIYDNDSIGDNYSNGIDMDLDIEGATDMDIDNNSSISNNNNEDELDELPPFEDENELPDAIVVEQAEVELDEYLRDLVADDDEEDSAPPIFDYSFLNPHGLLTLESFDLFGDNIKSKIYYWQNDVHHRLSKGKILLGGIMSITWCAIHGLFCFGIKDVMPLEDSMIMFDMLDHALANRGEQRQNFFDIVSNIFQRIPNTISSFIAGLSKEKQDQIKDFSQSLSKDQLDAYNNICNISNISTTNIRVPKTKKEADALLMKGRFSMLSRLPTPKIYTEGEGHAYVKISDVIDHALAEGLSINWLQDSHGNVNSDTINGSPFSKELLENMRSQVDDPDNTAFGTFILWSDGFCRTFVKQKDNSVWIITITFLNTDGKSKSPMHTYCVAIGKSSANHTPVFETILKELEDLRKVRTRYCSITGKFIKTCFRVGVYSTDRIERCSLLETSQIGTFGQRSHWACAVDPKSMPMCSVCFKTLMGTLPYSPYPDLKVFEEPGNVCQECCQWNFDNASAPLLEKYPTVSSGSVDCPDPPANRTVDETYHVPVMQQFSWLRQGLLFAYHNLTNSERSTRWRKFHLDDYLRSMGMSGAAIKGVWESACHKNNHPASELIPFMPYLWTIEHLLPMEGFINSPMHLLFHGVVDDVMVLVHKYMKKHNLLAKFEKFANEYLLEIESFRLVWCRLRKLPKALWLAEDILGYSRIMPFIYGLFFKNNFKFRSSDDSTRKCIQQLLNSLHVMISTLMNPSTSSDVDKIDSYIRVYLTCAHRASKRINGKGEDVWMDRGNHLSLLNLPAQIARHGPIRWYYEGVQEAYIQEVKPHLVANMRKTATYFRDKLCLIYKRKSMDFIKLRMKSYSAESAEEDGAVAVVPSRCGKGFYCYTDMAIIQEHFEKGLPLSAFVFNDDYVPTDRCLVWIAFGRSKGNINIVPLQYAEASVNDDELCGLGCATCTLHLENTYQEKLSCLHERISSHCLLLPFVKDKANRTPPTFDSKFAMVHDDWDVLTSSGKGEAAISRSLFNV